MLDNAKTLEEFTLGCRDGSIGPPREPYFDDRHGLTRQQLAYGPRLDDDKPTARKFEASCYGYQWPQHGGGPYSWDPYPRLVANAP